MANSVALDVLPLREIAMQLAYAFGKGVFSFRDHHEVDMVAHQGVPDQGNSMNREMFLEQPEINKPIVGREEDSLSMIAPLSYMVHITWENDTAKTWHR